MNTFYELRYTLFQLLIAKQMVPSALLSLFPFCSHFSRSVSLYSGCYSGVTVFFHFIFFTMVIFPQLLERRRLIINVQRTSNRNVLVLPVYLVSCVYSDEVLECRTQIGIDLKAYLRSNSIVETDLVANIVRFVILPVQQFGLEWKEIKACSRF